MDRTTLDVDATELLETLDALQARNGAPNGRDRPARDDGDATDDLRRPVSDRLRDGYGSL